MKADTKTSAEAEPLDPPAGPAPFVLVDRPLRAAIIGIFLMALAAALYVAKSILLPILVAFLLALVLSPVVRTFSKRGVPEAVSALMLVCAALAVILSSVYFLSGPVTQWVNDAPQIRQQLELRVAELRGAVEAVQVLTREMDEMAETEDPLTQRVELREPGLVSQAVSGIPVAAAQIMLMLFLLLFLLASGDLFLEKLVKTLPTLSDKKRGLRIAKDVERAVSRYLLTVTLINIGLGVVVGAAMFAIGMPNPALWGVMAAILNFIPYIGALAGVATVLVVAMISFADLSLIILAPLLYALCTAIEGNLITPAIVGRRLEMNPVVVFLSIALWGWLWGPMGILIAVPVLVVVRVFADHLEGLGGLSEFLAARDLPSTVVDPEDIAPSGG
jgi:predicted PurR-regulated permease PerM